MSAGVYLSDVCQYSIFAAWNGEGHNFFFGIKPIPDMVDLLFPLRIHRMPALSGCVGIGNQIVRFPEDHLFNGTIPESSPSRGTGIVSKWIAKISDPFEIRV